MATEFNVRIGDADREAIAAQLREHYADGRLTLDELNERLDQTFAAKIKADLDVVMRDLPHVARPLTDAPAAGFGNTAWQGQAWPGPTGRSSWDYGTGSGRRYGRAAFAPLLVLMWVALVFGAVTLFGIGGGTGRWPSSCSSRRSRSSSGCSGSAGGAGVRAVRGVRGVRGGDRGVRASDRPRLTVPGRRADGSQPILCSAGFRAGLRRLIVEYR